MKMLPDKTTIPINRILVDVNMPKVETDKKKEQTFKMKKVTINIKDDKKMTFTANETFEQRKLNKPLGFTKYHLNNKLNLSLSDIRIDRTRREVKVKRRVVIKDGGDEKDFGLIFMGEAIEVKPEVQSSMQEWLAKVESSE